MPSFEMSMKVSNSKAERPVLICVLGEFRLLKYGRPIALNSGGKAEGLLRELALSARPGVPRSTLQELLWPNGDSALASQSLHSLVYSLRKLLGGSIDRSQPIVYADGYYRLNVESVVAVDIICFEQFAASGDREARVGNTAEAARCYELAADFYQGDLCSSTDLKSIVERERLRSRHLSILTRLAEYHYSRGDYAECMNCAQRVLDHDPCREDAHCMIMRCYLRIGERAQALRQYRLCEEVLRREFDAIPEGTTTELFNTIRLSPDKA